MTTESRQALVERCLRCTAEMVWRHQTWQCGRCGFKLGCCEGVAQTCDDVHHEAPARGLHPP